MKNKSVLAFALAVLLLLLSIGCTVEDETGTTTTTGAATTTESSTTTSTTTIAQQMATTTQPVGIGGGNFDYETCYTIDFSVESVIYRLVDETALWEWCYTFEHFEMGGTRTKYEFNVYELIQEFGITREQVETACRGFEERHPDEIYFTDEQIDMLFTGTRDEVYRYFANPYAIYLGPGANVYSPKWLAEHTAAEYLQVGITYDILNAKIDDVLYPGFPEAAKEHILAQKDILQTLCASTSSESVTTTTTLSQGE